MKLYLRYSFSILLLLSGTLMSFSNTSARKNSSSELHCSVIQVAEDSNCTDKDSLAICKVLRDEYKKDINSLSVSKEYLKTVSLYWSDPGCERGPDIAVNAQYYRIYFSITTYEQDNSIRYVDEYVYYFPVVENGISFMSNVYHGNHYHGGSFRLIKGDGPSPYDYSVLSERLVRKKEPYLYKIEDIIRRSDSICVQ